MNGVSIENISMRFDLPNGGSVQALKNVSLHLKEGELLSVLGPSGCGKTTLLKIVAGFLSPTEGCIRMNGHEVTGPDAERGMVFHMDGARLWNAAAALGVSFREFTTDVGVDLVSLGATKNGAMGAEAIVVINPDVVEGMLYLRKFSMQLASKMRFISAQIQTLFDDSLGIRSATHANAMAARLRQKLEAAIAEGSISGLTFSQPTHANAVFARLSNTAADRLRETVRFYDWDRPSGEVRWMCSFDTTEDDIDWFVEEITKALAAD